jgi:hypothetical protein
MVFVLLKVVFWVQLTPGFMTFAGSVDLWPGGWSGLQLDSFKNRKGG